MILRLDFIAGIIDKSKVTCDFTKTDTQLFVETIGILDFGTYATRYFRVVPKIILQYFSCEVLILEIVIYNTLRIEEY